jgi:hypothetical protein
MQVNIKDWLELDGDPGCDRSEPVIHHAVGGALLLVTTSVSQSFFKEGECQKTESGSTSDISTTYIIKFSIYLFPSKFLFCRLGLSFASLIWMISPPVNPD